MASTFDANRVKVMDDFGKAVVKDQKDRLRNFQKNDTGALSASLEYRLQKDSDGTVGVVFLSLDYGKYVDSGRKPYKGYPAMRLVTNPVELKRRKIAKEGTKPFQIFREGGDVFSARRMKKLMDDYEEAAVKDLEDLIDEINKDK